MMATFPESTSQGNPSHGNPSSFPSFGNTDVSYTKMLSLPRLTIGLPIWLFSTSKFSSVQTAFQSISPPLEQHQPHVGPKVYPSPSLPISLPHSSSSLGESLDSNNKEARKKKKKTNK